MANFLTFPGTAGFLTTPFTLMSTEFVGLTSSATIVSASAINQTNTANGIYGYVYLTVGSATFTPTAGGNISGWWLNSVDGGTTYETAISTVGPQARPPDWIIPLSTTGTVSSGIYMTQVIRLPWATAKTYIQNNAGTTLGASGSQYPTIKCAPVAVSW